MSTQKQLRTITFITGLVPGACPFAGSTLAQQHVCAFFRSD